MSTASLGHQRLKPNGTRNVTIVAAIATAVKSIPVSPNATPVASALGTGLPPAAGAALSAPTVSVAVSSMSSLVIVSEIMIPLGGDGCGLGPKPTWRKQRRAPHPQGGAPFRAESTSYHGV